MIIFGGSKSAGISREVAQKTGAESGDIKIEKFPDGEFYLRILSDVKRQECTVIQSLNTNDSIVELLLLLDLLKDLDAKKIHTVITYLGYARQNKRFNGNESMSAKTILKLVDEFSDSIAVINCHFLHSPGEFEFENVKIVNLDAFPVIANYFKDKLDKPIVISPDKGSMNYARVVSEILDCNYDYLEKERISGEDVKTSPKRLDVANRDVLLIDDMISTGRTIIKAADIIRSQNPKSITTACIHGVFSRGVVGGVVCTDTILTEVSRISVTDLIADYLRGLE